MADYTVVAASVLAAANAGTRDGVAGATITAGQALYKDPTDQSLKLADANGVAATRTVVGISLNGGASGQPIKYVVSDASFTPGFTVGAGAVVALSDTPGGLCPVADKTAGDYTTIIGLGVGTNKIALSFLASLVVNP